MNRNLRSTLFLAAALLVPSLVSADDFHPIPNSVKYRDSGVPNAKGNAGAAAIEVRALFNKNGSTDVEATTAAFEAPGSPTATIKNVHIDVNGQIHDFTGNDGNTFVAAGLSGLAPGATVPVHANVKDLNGSNESIKVNAKVKKRPDLTFVGIQSQPHAMVGMPVDVVATIHEQNGQSGARADCVAYVDGAEVDRADDIWIDAGGTVDCVLSPAFTTAGWKNIQVVLEHVRPQDWDLADNQVYATTTIHAYDEEIDFWYATAQDETSRYYTRYYGPNYEDVFDTSGWRSSASVNGTQPELLNPETLTMDFTVTTDGVPFTDMHGIRFTGWSSDDNFRMRCGRAFFGATRAQICTSQRPSQVEAGTGSTQFGAATSNADVTYYSRHWSVYYDPDGTPNVYTSESSYTEQTGNGQRIGNSVAIHMSVTDGMRTLWADPFINLQSNEYHDGYNNCWEWGGCEEFHRDLVQKFGTVSGGLNN
jgi:hypothetical protein